MPKARQILIAAIALICFSGFCGNAPAITSAMSITGSVGTVITYTITANKGTPPYTFTVTGTLPDGLTYDNVNKIAGTPTVAGSSAVTLIVTDSANGTGNAQLQITINPLQNSTPFRFLTTSLPDGSTNAVYAATLLTANAAGPVT